MIEIKIPRVMRGFGYNLELPTTVRRTAILKMLKYSGRDSVLYNLSSLMLLKKRNKQFREYGRLKSDLRFFLKKVRI